MAELNYKLGRDIREAKAMTENLDQYVRGDQLYVQIGGLGAGLGGSRMPSLTVGALLLRLRRLTELKDQLTSEQKAEFDAVVAQHNTVRTEWRLHYDEKLAWEAKSRLDAMRQFFSECAENPRTCGGNYRPEALRRTIVQEIVDAMDEAGLEDDALRPKLKETDSRLHRFLKPAEFLWDAQIAAVYPDDKFWWLYQHPDGTA